MEESIVSPFLGFACDSSSITNQITALTSAVSEFGAQVNTGMADEATFNSFLDRLESGDVQSVMDMYQTELDSWLETVQ